MEILAAQTYMYKKLALKIIITYGSVEIIFRELTHRQFTRTLVFVLFTLG